MASTAAPPEDTHVAGRTDATATEGSRQVTNEAVDRRDAGPTASALAHSTLGRARPARLASGAISFVGAWTVAFAIARLTGAAAVVLLLVAGAVGLTASCLSGWWRIRSVRGIRARGPGLTQVGEQWSLDVEIDDPFTRRAALSLLVHPEHHPDAAASTADAAARNELDFAIADGDAGTITTFTGWIATLGTGGLIWWRRKITVEVDPIRVAPRPRGPLLPVAETPTTSDGASTMGRGPAVGDPNGVRPWRSGESNLTIHWPSTVRSRQVIARERDTAVESSWSVPLDVDPERLRYTLDEGIRSGRDVDVTAPDLAAPSSVRDRGASARWATAAADRRRQREQKPTEQLSLWQRPIGGGATSRINEAAVMSRTARWSAAVAAGIALNMLLGALDNTATTRLLATGGILVGAALSMRFRDGVAPMKARLVVTLLAFGALARIAIQASSIGGLIEALRGPMPDLLVVLLILHGVESVNARTVRVHLAITAVVVAYATGLRIDEYVGWWLAGWGAALTCSLVALASASRPPRSNARSTARSAGWLGVSTAAVLGIGVFVPVPDGPADLGLPALSDDSAVLDRPGTLAGPDGEPATSAEGDTTRGSLGSTGGYLGFSETLDTSVRGGLGDDIVMRVRAPEPAFWRGQTFSDFDGRTWSVSGGDGVLAQGPRIDVPPTLGDLSFDDVPTEEFRQTYHVDADLPNLVFAAARASTLVFDGAVQLRPDGALRADRTLTTGTIYTVVSQRAQVTEELLRSQGDLATWFAPVAGPDGDGDERLTPLLTVPDSTSQRTIDLATDLRVDDSTYDTILAYQRWLGANTEYDLDAPVPAASVDAVDDFLFESQRGFCEQIASTLVVMLRSQGVPARLATGYIPGERDRVSGVWKVRSSDAHAWVEVWFPVTGWQAFDPTASVPLSGEADPASVGSDLAGALIDGIRSHATQVGLVAIGGIALVGAGRLVAEARRRRRRGPWGLLYDRFAALAPDVSGGSATAIAEAIERRLDARGLEPRGDAADPARLAERFDRVAFDPIYEPTPDDMTAARTELAALERALKRRIRTTSS